MGFVISATHGLANPYFSWIFAGVEVECRKNNYAVFFASTAEDLVPLATQADRQTSRKVDGLIMVYRHGQHDESQIMKTARFVPIVVLNHFMEELDVPSVLPDNVEGAYTATKYLIELGHKRIAHITGARGWIDSEERIVGYEKALSEAGSPIDEKLICDGDFEFPSGYEVMGRLVDMPDRPTAIFAGNDWMALGAMKKIHESGLSIPGDFSVVGFDDQEIAELAYPSLTTVRIPKMEIGKTAFKLLQEMIESGATSVTDRKRIVATTLVKRDSCGARGG